MRNLFSTDIAEKIVDCTPDLEPDDDAVQSHLEIFGWLLAHPEIADYCVIEPNWPMEPYLESAIFIADNQVFGEDPEHIQFLGIQVRSAAWRRIGSDDPLSFTRVMRAPRIFDRLNSDHSIDASTVRSINKQQTADLVLGDAESGQSPDDWIYPIRCRHGKSLTI